MAYGQDCIRSIPVSWVITPISFPVETNKSPEAGS
jgi:hypothetical protein